MECNVLCCQIRIILDLHEYDLIIINSSAGKDSLCSLFEICRMAKEQLYPLGNIVVSHQDLGDMEWAGTKELAKTQAEFFGLKIYYSKRRDENGKEETLLEYVERRGMWMSNRERFCTSDFKRGPGARVVTMLTKKMGKCKVLHVFGFRKDESPSRKKKEPISVNIKLTTRKRIVHDYLPIHEWNADCVWSTIRIHKLPYHKAYDLGIPRLSCVFCFYSPFDVLVVAGYENPELLERYVIVEEKTGHKFTMEHSLADVKKAIQEGYKPKKLTDWVM